jgi:flagellar motility protein MotE (MotC chaperone)
VAQKRGDLVTSLLAVLMLLEIAGLAGLAGYLIFTGKVTPEQVRLAYKAYRKEITQQTFEDAEAWRKHLADEARRKARQPSGADARRKLAAAAVEAEAMRLGLQRLLKEAQDRDKLVQLRIEELDQKHRGLDDKEQRIDAKIAAHAAGGGQESFMKMVAIMKAMKPKALKDILVQMDEGTVVDVLRTLGARQAAKVLAEFKSPAELDLKRRYLDVIRAGDVATAPAGR